MALEQGKSGKGIGEGAAPRRVLLVRPSALGDVARTVPVAVSIKKRWPGCRLDWVVNRGFESVVKDHPCVDGVIPFDRDRPRVFLRLMRLVRSRGYDVVFDLQGLARSGLLAWASGAKRRVGFADAREGGWLGCNVRHDVGLAGEGGRPWAADHAKGVTAVTRMLGLLFAEGFSSEQVVEDLRLYVGESERAWGERWRGEVGVEAGGYAVLAPTAKWGCKCWPVERFAAVAETLLREELVGKVAVVCGPGERSAVQAGFKESMLEGMRGVGGGGLWSRVVWPETGVGELMSVIAGSGLVVCNDSAALHLAVGLGVDTVSVFGPTDPALVGPWVGPGVGDGLGGRHVVLRAGGSVDGAVDYRKWGQDDTLMREVEAGAVLGAARSALVGGGD